MGTNVVEGCCGVGTKPVSPHPFVEVAWQLFRRNIFHRLELQFGFRPVAFDGLRVYIFQCGSRSYHFRPVAFDGLSMYTCGWIDEVLAVVHSSVGVVIVSAQLTVRSPLIAVDDRSGQHDTLDDGEQRHHSMVLYELHVADSRCF